MSINFFNEDRSVGELNQKKIKNWLKFVIKSEFYIMGEISVIFCSDEYLLRINRDYLNHDYYTDIITFNYVEEKKISGDIFISVERVNENANEFKVDYLNELNRVIVHGVLHLIGFDDKNDSEKKEMTKKENEYLEKIGMF